MVTHCYTPVLGKRLRVTSLNTCGATDVNSRQVVTEGFITVTFSSETEDGAEIIQKNAAGHLCINEKLADSFKRLTVEVDFCGVNPSLLTLVSNAKPYNDYAGDVAGFTIPEGEINKAFALELWTGLAGQACLPGQVDESSGYLLLPFVRAGVMGDITIDGENAVTFQVTAAYTKGGNGWGVGPYNVLRALPVPGKQSVTITGAPTGGTFVLTFKGASTNPLAFGSTAAAVQTALEGLPTIGVGNVTVTGGPLPGTALTVTFAGVLAGAPQPLMTAVGSFTGGTTPAIAVASVASGTPGAPSKLPSLLDPYDHMLMIDTALAPPPTACSPSIIPAGG